MDLKKKFKTACLTGILSLAASFGKAADINLQSSPEAKKATTEIKSNQHDPSDDIALYFSPDELATALQKADLSQEQIEKFLNVYTSKTDEK